MFKRFRVIIWLYILFMVAGGAWITKSRTTDWDSTLNVAIYPINGDGSEVTQKYIEKLSNDTFSDIEEFFDKEARRYGLSLKHPFDFYLSKQLDASPPKPPVKGSTFSIMLWSLELRYWASSNDNYPYPKQIQIFVIYFDPETTPTVAHSLGLQQGLIGVVNAFSEKRMTRENNVIITHELLHTVGAIDKYDPASNMPLYPVGYANPDQDPLYPQKQAEIMGGRIPIDKNEADTPQKLKQVIIGEATATEIRWGMAQ